MQGPKQRLRTARRRPGGESPGAGFGSGLVLFAQMVGTALIAGSAQARPAPVDLLDGGAYDRPTANAAGGPPTTALGSASLRGPAAAGLPYNECVSYARQISGIAIHGDALTWWDQAAGRYARGYRPRVGAVMSFRPYGAMQLGHVAAVSRIIDSRTVLLRHANWSPVDGQRGRIEDDVRAVDVSPDNDWSAVRVWYAPLGDLGTTHWPVNGFIYNSPPDREDRRTDRLAAISATPVRTPAAPTAATAVPAGRIGADFLKGIVPEVKTVRPAPAFGALAPAARQPLASRAGPTAPPSGVTASFAAVASGSTAALPASSLRDDPIGRIIATRLAKPSR